MDFYSYSFGFAKSLKGFRIFYNLWAKWHIFLYPTTFTTKIFGETFYLQLTQWMDLTSKKNNKIFMANIPFKRTISTLHACMRTIIYFIQTDIIIWLVSKSTYINLFYIANDAHVSSSTVKWFWNGGFHPLWKSYHKLYKIGVYFFFGVKNVHNIVVNEVAKAPLKCFIYHISPSVSNHHEM